MLDVTTKQQAYRQIHTDNSFTHTCFNTMDDYWHNYLLENLDQGSVVFVTDSNQT